MNHNELKKRAGAIRWFHTMDLGGGVVTGGVDDTPRKLERIRLPEDLSGKTVLDVGAWDGFFSFEAKKRGAKRVVAVDSFCWGGDGWGTKEGFELARKTLGLQVEDVEMEVLELSPERPGGSFDTVLFLGVLYHMKHPLLALEKIASVTKGLLILETEADLVGLGAPAAAFYAGKECNEDPTNWWGPNPAALEAMLKAAGFRKTKIVWGPQSAVYRMTRAAWKLLKRGKNPFRERRRARVVIHAWK